jgi:molybdopterin synthase sulfur carrier subunit
MKRNMMNLKVQYFGMLAEVAGVPSEEWIVEDAITIGRLRSEIQKKYGEMKISKVKVAVNKQIAGDDFVIIPESTIALLPPFAGG